MKKEYTHVSGWEKWCKGIEDARSEEEKELLNLTRDMRNHAVKCGPLLAEVVTKIKMPRPEIKRLNNVGPGRILIQGTLQNCQFIHLNPTTGEMTIFPFAKTMNFGRVEPKFAQHKDLLVECQKYYALLTPFVRECVKRFGRPNDGGGGSARNLNSHSEGPQPTHL